MSADGSLGELARALSAPDEAHALPAACYLDPGFFEAERERIFRREWHAVARWDELPEPGDYRAIDLFDEPLMLVRDESRRLRAFSRTCRHRAFPIVQGEGNAKRLVCPFHRWSYDLDGRLRAAPLMEEVPGFDREACRLPELPLEEWQGFVLVNLDLEATPLVPALKPLDEAIAPLGFRELVRADTLRFDSPWNWKVMVENFMESYHHMGAHADTLQRSNPAKGTHSVEVEGPFALLENPAVRDAEPFWVMQIFPTLLLSLSRGASPFATWYEMRIDRHDHFDLHIHLLLPPDAAANERAVAGMRRAIETIHGEDIPMCSGIQRGLRSRLWTPGRLSRHERTLWRFHRYLAGRLAGA